MKPDIDSLLRPISVEAPAGEDISFSAEFDAIQEARREEDASLAQGDWVCDVKKADRQRVVDKPSQVLRARRMAIRIAVAAAILSAIGWFSPQNAIPLMCKIWG